jgi:hypothetical protein
VYEQPLIATSPGGKGAIQTSTNWSGYAVTGTTYSSLSASWVEPTATCAAGQSNAYGPPAAAFWVGIDGYSNGTVEQTGSDSDCTAAGKPHYYAWYELYPAGSANLPAGTNPVKPGDVMTASVTSSSGTKFTLTISDTTKGWTFTKSFTLKTAAQRLSDEWIVESPEECGAECGILPLADFGTVHFTNSEGTTTSSNTETPISGFSTVNEIELKNPKLEALPTKLTAGGTAFSVTWKNL